MAVAVLKKGEGRGIKSGGMWIFDNEIARIDGELENGDVAEVLDFDGYPMGKAFINRNSKIRARMLTRNPGQEIDREFFRARIKDAWEYRKQTVDTKSCRVVFGEADFLPGFLADKFEDVLVIQSLALGIDRFKGMLAELLIEVLAQDGIRVRGVYERSDAKVRLKEGMERVKGFLGEPFPTEVEIIENGVKYLVDVKDGQKTGFFLDQKYNRLEMQKICRGKKTLDCFTHTGSFALNAAFAGAKSVLGVDESELAVRQAEKNAKLNGLAGSARFMQADVFELLPKLERQGEKFDVVILDPPAFAKSKSSVKNAVKGYREINLRAMRLLAPGGYLATCSCSRFIDPELFEKTVCQAASGARKRLRLAQRRGQSPDHPVLLPAGESDYLKFYIFQVCEEK